MDDDHAEPPDPDVEALAAWDPSVLDGVDLGAGARRRAMEREQAGREARLARWPVVDEAWARRLEGRRRDGFSPPDAAGPSR